MSQTRWIEECVDAAVLIDSAGVVRVFNAGAQNLFGLERGDALGRPASDIHPALAAPAEGEAAGGDQEIRIVRPDGEKRFGLLSLSTVTSAAGDCRLAMLKDATEAANTRMKLKLYVAIADATQRVVVVTDMSDRILFVNKAFTRLFGHTEAEAIGQSPARILAGRYTDLETLGRLQRQCTVNTTASDEILAYDKNGDEVWISATVNVVHNSAGKPVNVVALIDDITEAKRIQMVQHEVLDALANDMPLGEVARLICRNISAIAPDVLPSVLRIDPDGLMRPLAAPGLPAEFVDMIDGFAIGPDIGSCGSAAYAGHTILTRDIATDERWAAFRELPLSAGLRACWSTPIKAKDGRVIGVFALYFRESRGPSAWHEKIVASIIHLCSLAIERYEARTQIRQLAYFDTLTGLQNRASLRETFADLLAGPNGVARAAFLFLDIDNFKDVNDTLGHAVGDRLLAAIASVLKANVGPCDIVSRHGGDEFVIVLPDCDAVRAAHVAERLRTACLEPISTEGATISATTSIGISLYPADGADADTLLKNADTAMYEAKRAGRGAYRLFNPAMREALEERIAYNRLSRSSAPPARETARSA